MSKLPDQIQINLTISDDRWPLLSAVGTRQGTCGASAVTKVSQQYDLAYTKFEEILHNLLRPAVEELIRRRKQING